MNISDSTDFGKDISVIFNSEYGLKLKYDMATRLVCESLSASMVSILLYDSRDDALVCKGNYIDPIQSQLKTKNASVRVILSNISICEFLRSREQQTDVSICSALYKQYKESLMYSRDISEADFRIVCEVFKTNQQLYTDYRAGFQSDKYAIDSKTITGDYFKELLLYSPKYYNSVKITDLSQEKESRKQCITLLRRNMGIRIADAGFYIGLPLYATERYFGVLRIMFPAKMSFVLYDEGLYSLDSVYQERLGYFAQLISLHLETNYYLESYKKLSSLNETITPETIDKLQPTCERLGGVVNCNGVLIRIFDEAESEPEVKGYTESLRQYVRFLRIYRDAKLENNHRFSGSLIDIFEKNKSYLAVNFDSSIYRTKKAKAFITDEEGNVIERAIDLELDDFKSPEYRQKLKKLNIDQVTVVPIPAIEKSFMILTNTKNRKFIKADVEMLILAARGIGLEIKHIQDTKKISEQEKSIAQKESVRNVVHQLGAPLVAVRGHVRNIVNNDVPDYLVKDRWSRVFRMLQNVTNQINGAQRILDLDTNPITVSKSGAIDLPGFLIDRSITFQAISGAKGIGIHVYSDTDEKVQVRKIDKELLTEVFNNLIDNAVKYSFELKQLRTKGINYDSRDYRSEGNVLISYSSSDTFNTITITNWGAVIRKDQRKEIFNKHKRLDSAKQFAAVGSGIGLYIVKIILDKMGIGIDVSGEGYQTTFTVKIPK